MASPDGPLDDPRAPLWARLVGFLALVGAIAALTAIVLVRDRDREQRSGAGAGAATAETVALPADNGGSMVPPTTVLAPPGSGPSTLPRRARTNDGVALELERVLKRDIGFTHKVSCTPAGALQTGEVLECYAAAEPPIKEAPPSSILAVVIDDGGRFVWARTEGDSYNLATLTADPTLTCDALAGAGSSYAYVLAYFEANNRPSALDPSGAGRPCADRFSQQDIDATFASAI
ncbi:MAG: hypothetical protein HYX32_04875 [Actinobacteria bacterium]|nr:hypothetical protein [Actinomycetota bacterium]